MPACWVSAVNGSDSNSGLTENAPKRTLAAIRTVARTLMASASEAVTVWCHGTFMEAFTLNGSDAGSHLYRYRRWGDEFSIAGLDPVAAEWTKDDSGLYYADVGTGLDFRHVWIGGRICYVAEDTTEYAILAFNLDGTVDVPAAAVDGLTDGAFFRVRPDGWMISEVRYDSHTVDGDVATVTVKSPEAEIWANRANGPFRVEGQHFTVRNQFAFLSTATPYRFWYDTTEGLLWVSAPASVTTAAALESLGVHLPLGETVLTLSGCSKIRIEECDLTGGDWPDPNTNGFMGYNPGLVYSWTGSAAVANVRLPGLIEATNATDVCLYRCLFTDIGEEATIIRSGCKRFYVQQAFYRRVAGSGFFTDATDNTIERLTSGQIIENVYLEDTYFRGVGVEWAGCAGALQVCKNSEMRHLDAEDIGGYVFMLSDGSRFDGEQPYYSIYGLSCHHYRVRRGMSEVVDGGASYIAGLCSPQTVSEMPAVGFKMPRASFYAFDIGEMAPVEDINWRGTYNAGTAYAPGDGVLYSAATFAARYVCTAATTGNLPTNTAYWKLSEGFRAGVYCDLGSQWVMVGPGKIDGVDVGINMNCTRFNEYADIQITNSLGFEREVNYAGISRRTYNPPPTDTYTNGNYKTPWTSAATANFDGDAGAVPPVSPFTDLFPFEEIGDLFVNGTTPPFNHLSTFSNVGSDVRLLMRGVGVRYKAREYWRSRGLID